MWYKIVVDGSDGRHVERAIDAREDGEIQAEIIEAVKEYRRLYPDAPPFDYEIQVSHA